VGGLERGRKGKEKGLNNLLFKRGFTVVSLEISLRTVRQKGRCKEGYKVLFKNSKGRRGFEWNVKFPLFSSEEKKGGKGESRLVMARKGVMFNSLVDD